STFIANSCIAYFADQKCICPVNQFWTGTVCTSKYGEGVPCDAHCKCLSNNCIQDWYYNYYGSWQYYYHCPITNGIGVPCNNDDCKCLSNNCILGWYSGYYGSSQYYDHCS
ncbi:unnamed protein product, partial [Brachionus calyciflorus]